MFNVGWGGDVGNYCGAICETHASMTKLCVYHINKSNAPK